MHTKPPTIPKLNTHSIPDQISYDHHTHHYPERNISPIALLIVINRDVTPAKQHTTSITTSFTIDILV